MPYVKLSAQIICVVALISLSSLALDSTFYDNTTTEAINRIENQISFDTGLRIGHNENHQASSLHLGHVVDVQNKVTKSAASASSLMVSSSPLKKLPEVKRHLSDSKRKEKISVKIVVYDKIKGYLNWMQDWFHLAAEQRCNTICTFTDNINEVI